MKTLSCFALLGLTTLSVLTGCGGGGGSAAPTDELLTGGSSRVWSVSLIDANQNFNRGDDDRNTYTACPNSYTRTGAGPAWECGATDTITFHEDRRVTYSVGATPGTGTWSLRGSTLTITFDGRTTSDQVEVRNNDRLILRRISRTSGGVSDTAEAGSAYVIVGSIGG
jgi:Lipocalin-like domain